MKLKYKRIIIPLVSLILLFNIGIAYADNHTILDKTKGGLQNTIDKSFGGEDGGTILTSLNAQPDQEDRFIYGIIVVINYILTFTGVIFFLILVYGGYLWMFARGNEDQVLRAKKITKEVILGIIIIMLSWVFTQFIIYNLGQVTKIQ